MTFPRQCSAVAAVIAGLLHNAPAMAESQELWHRSLDSLENLGTSIESDPAVKKEGKASIRVETAWPTVVNLAEIDAPDIEAATLVYKAELRSEGLTGAAYLEMWCHFPDGGRYFSRGLDSTVTGDSGWQQVETKFFLQAGQRPSKVTLNLVVQGQGRVWVDALALSREPLP